MGDSGAHSSVTGSRDIWDRVLGGCGAPHQDMGDGVPAQDTVDVRDMGDTEATGSADALESDLSHG